MDKTLSYLQCIYPGEIPTLYTLLTHIMWMYMHINIYSDPSFLQVLGQRPAAINEFPRSRDTIFMYLFNVCLDLLKPSLYC